MKNTAQIEIPIQPVESPVICKPYDEPKDHWFYDKETGIATQAGTRRDAGYWYKTERVGTGQTALFLEEDHDLLTLVNLLRKDVKRWRDADYRGASNVTKDLLRHWVRTDRERRLFFCQREAVETIIYLTELRIPGKSSRTGFQNFNLNDKDLALLLKGERPTPSREYDQQRAVWDLRSNFRSQNETAADVASFKISDLRSEEIGGGASVIV